MIYKKSVNSKIKKETFHIKQFLIILIFKNKNIRCMKKKNIIHSYYFSYTFCA